ncbi:LOW QUALITY PROTEIN: hypothetical protein CRUP_009590 [Coryphaenoides rupestris]|nr:LOW QUALITY PROTEIN: hypothetical protein CRUP_009590 [Coryphaenoides rupestris]
MDRMKRPLTLGCFILHICFGPGALLLELLELKGVVIGAPKANTSQPNVTEGGAVYLCPWSGGSCSAVPFDEQGDRYFEMNDVDTQVEFKSHQWFGAVVRAHHNTVLIQTRQAQGCYDDSYQGYSVSAGEFSGDGVEDVVAGVPRGLMLYGLVSILDGRNLKSVLNLTGAQMGSYFGYSVAVTDINSDGLDDLIVGAPMFMRRGPDGRLEELGRLYVYLQRGPLLLEPSLPHLRGPGPDSRFGSSLAPLGDTWLWAVPTEEKTNRDCFGYAIRGNTDLDQNGYPDLIVGAFGADKAVLYRARPIVTASASLAVQPNMFNPEEKTYTHGLQPVLNQTTQQLLVQKGRTSHVARNDGRDRAEVYMGDENPLALTFNARNQGEGGAYEAELYVGIPPGADYSGIARSNLSLSQLACSYEAENLTRYLLCDLGNPMKSGASIWAGLRFTLPRLKDTHKTVQFELQIRRHEKLLVEKRLSPDNELLEVVVAVAGMRTSPENELLEVVVAVAGMRTSPENELLEVVVAVAGMRTSPENELLEVVVAADMRTSPGSELLEVVAAGMRTSSENGLVAAGMRAPTSPECERLEVVGLIMRLELGVDPAHNRPGQMKQGKEQARHHLLQCLLRKPEFDVAESPPHPQGCQVPGTPDLHAHVEQALSVQGLQEGFLCHVDLLRKLHPLKQRIALSDTNVTRMPLILTKKERIYKLNNQQNQNENNSQSEVVLFNLEVAVQAVVILQGASQSLREEQDVGPEIKHVYELVNNGPSSISQASLEVRCPLRGDLCTKLQPPTTETPALLSPSPQHRIQRRDISRDPLAIPSHLSCAAVECWALRCRAGLLGTGASAILSIRSRVWAETFAEPYKQFVLECSVEYRVEKMPYSITPKSKPSGSQKVTNTVVWTQPEHQYLVPVWIIILAILAGLLLLSLLIYLLYKMGFFKRSNPYGTTMEKAKLRPQASSEA